MKNYRSIPLAQITIPSYYLKQDDEKKQKRLKAIIGKRNQTSVIHVREVEKDSYELIAGRKVYKCLKDLNHDSAICYNHGKVSLQEAKRIYLELGLQEYETDTVELAKLIEDVTHVYKPYELTQTIPFSLGEIEIYQSYLIFDWDGLWDTFRQKQYEAKKRRDRKKQQENLEATLTPSKRAEIQLERLYKGISRVA